MKITKAQIKKFWPWMNHASTRLSAINRFLNEEHKFKCVCGYSAPTEKEGTYTDEERGGWKACNNCGMI
tara:strand:+ start:910 stop:1116 length:207 start_codon:yes stop_codon:yes gene_type:complete